MLANADREVPRQCYCCPILMFEHLCCHNMRMYFFKIWLRFKIKLHFAQAARASALQPASQSCQMKDSDAEQVSRSSWTNVQTNKWMNDSLNEWEAEQLSVRGAMVRCDVCKLLVLLIGVIIASTSASESAHLLICSFTYGWHPEKGLF